MSKSTLRQINLIFLSIGILLFLGFAIYQYQVDKSAQAIVQYNSDLLTPVQRQTHQLAQQLANQSWDYDRPISVNSQEQFEEIERNTRNLTTQIQQIIATKMRAGINSPSLNHAEFVQQKLTNLSDQNLLLASTVNAHTCLHRQSTEFRRQQSALDRDLENYANTADYAEGLGILIKIDNSYQTLAQMIKTATNCFPLTLREQNIYSDVQGTANTDLASITTYRQKFLQPLIKLYQAKDYGAVPDFLDRQKKHSQVKIIFPELWRNPKGTNSSYLASQLQSIVIGIARDTQI